MDRKGKRPMVSPDEPRRKHLRTPIAVSHPQSSVRCASSSNAIHAPEGTSAASQDKHHDGKHRLGVEQYEEFLAKVKESLSKTTREKQRLHLLMQAKRQYNSSLIRCYDDYIKKLMAKTNRISRKIKLLKNHHVLEGPSTVEPFTLDAPNCYCQFCGALMWRQESSKATRHHQTPKFSLCCKEGRVKLPPLREPPDFLKWLFELNDAVAKHFRDFIRAYNAVFSFVSMGGKVNHNINQGKGVYVFSISGQVYHHIGSLLPPPGRSPKFAQLYIHDTSHEVTNRMEAFNATYRGNPLQETLIQSLKEMFDEHNKLVQVFRYARDRLDGQDVQQMEVRLLAARKRDGREYDMPTDINELAALVVNDTGIETYDQDIVVQLQSTKLTSVSMRHPSLMALQYPLLFPYGEDGWRPDIKISRGFLSQRQFYAYRLQTRPAESSTLFLSGKLFQQYVVNAYTLIEAERLDFIRSNQRKFHCNIYAGILDSFLSGDTDVGLTGKHIILSSSHTGSPRYMYENFQDAMAICRWFGYPDLFLTFTCNASWPEIQFMSDLINASGRTDPNRADIIARVFKMKLHQLLDEIKSKNIFGRSCAEIYTIEFQKRGLPHAHILIFLVSQDKFVGPERIDTIISSEIPDKNVDPQCFQAVKKYMLHGPCGASSPNAPCTNAGKCQKHFPKKFHPETTIDEDGFPIYRRRQDGRTIIKSGFTLDN